MHYLNVIPASYFHSEPRTCLRSTTAQHLPLPQHNSWSKSSDLTSLLARDCHGLTGPGVRMPAVRSVLHLSHCYLIHPCASNRDVGASPDRVVKLVALRRFRKVVFRDLILLDLPASRVASSSQCICKHDFTPFIKFCVHIAWRSARLSHNVWCIYEPRSTQLTVQSDFTSVS